MIDLSALITEVRTQIAATWTDVLAGAGILEAEHLDQIAWADLALPYAVILIEECPRDPDGADDVLWFRPPVQVYYVAQSVGPSSGIRTKLQSLMSAFWPTDPLTTGQIFGLSDPAWHGDLPANQELQSRGSTARAGRVILDVLVTE